MNAIVHAVQTLADFCGARDFPTLAQAPHVDVAVLFGGSILQGAAEMAHIIQSGIADTTVIVGGAGHTTQTLRDRMHAVYPHIETQGRTEASIFQECLETVYGVKADHLETESTNCGNNITNLLALLADKRIPCKSILLMQDATMQRRMAATLCKYSDMRIVNYACYRAVITEKDGQIAFANDIFGMWDMERFITLLMGEIRRLRDDENGYGPCGANYIAHVDIPQEVEAAYRTLGTSWQPRAEWKIVFICQ